MSHSYAPYIYIPHAWHAFIAQPHLLGYLLSPTGTRGCNHTHHTHIHSSHTHTRVRARAPLCTPLCTLCNLQGGMAVHTQPSLQGTP